MQHHFSLLLLVHIKSKITLLVTHKQMYLLFLCSYCVKLYCVYCSIAFCYRGNYMCQTFNSESKINQNLFRFRSSQSKSNSHHLRDVDVRDVKGSLVHVISSVQLGCSSANNPSSPKKSDERQGSWIDFICQRSSIDFFGKMIYSLVKI